MKVDAACFIDGAWTCSGQTFDVMDPATGQPIASAADASVEDALSAVTAAHQAFDTWRSTPPRQRGEVLRRAFELMTERHDEIAELIVRENGKALADARAETSYAAEFFRWYSEEAVRADGSISTAPAGDKRILVLHEPVGVSVLVTPWNFPAAMATRKIGPALAAGCPVVLKPAPDTPLTAARVVEILADAGVPDGVVNLVPTQRAAEVVSAMLKDPRVRKLSFTGSTPVGRLLLGECAGSVVNTSMELGGNAPFLVLADADIESAVEGAMVAKLRNGGEACTAANRFYVHRSVADEFSARLTDRMAELTVGPGLDPDVDIGPLVNAAAIDKVQGLVDQACANGARRRLGGHRLDRPGYFYPPTVLEDVSPDSAVLREEIFGPVAPLVTFDDENEAVAMANDTEYGLVAYLYTRDLARGLRISEQIEAGMIGLNRGLVSDPAAPFGGVKQSGIGREGGHEGLLDYIETKYVATQW